MKQNQTIRRGFSLIELVIVVVIIAIIAAIAVPRMSRGAAGANEAALMQNLAQMRTAIELFAAEHGGLLPSSTPATFIQQMTQYSKADGITFSPTKDPAFPYGPYLKDLPPQPCGQFKGSTVLTNTSGNTATAGWYYDGATIFCNSGDSYVDAAGKKYNSY